MNNFFSAILFLAFLASLALSDCPNSTYTYTTTNSIVNSNGSTTTTNVTYITQVITCITTTPSPSICNCSGHGTCNETNGACVCSNGWTGTNCSQPFNLLCRNNCSGQGTCNTSTGSCVCNAGYSGINCSTKQCPNSCSNHGNCNTNTGACLCQTGFIGLDCSQTNANKSVGVSSVLSGFISGNPQGVDSYESRLNWIGTTQAIQKVYGGFCISILQYVFSYQIQVIWDTYHQVPLLNMDLSTCTTQNGPYPGNATVLVNKGVYDAWINQTAQLLVTFLSGKDGILGTSDDRRIYFEPMHEVNGNWYTHSASNGGTNPGLSSQSDYIAAYRRIYSMIMNYNTALNKTHISWIWNIMNKDYGSTEWGYHKMATYYPGDTYVDWMTIDLYNQGYAYNPGSWDTPNLMLDNCLAILRNLSSKPIGIVEWGVTSLSNYEVMNVTAKSNWINQMCSYIEQNGIKFALYYDVSSKVTPDGIDWAVWNATNGDSSYVYVHADGVKETIYTYSAYANCTRRWTGSNVTNPRLLTDSQFQGL